VDDLPATVNSGLDGIYSLAFFEASRPRCPPDERPEFPLLDSAPPLGRRQDSGPIGRCKYLLIACGI